MWDPQQLPGLPSDHAKLDQKGLYVTLRAGHVAQGTAGLYVPRLLDRARGRAVFY